MHTTIAARAAARSLAFLCVLTTGAAGCAKARGGANCYVDADGDGYGAKTSPETFYGECPDGYADNDLDCYDSDSDPVAAEVHPGQPSYFDRGYASTNEFDYDCDGIESMQESDYPTGQDTGCTYTCDSHGGETECLAVSTLPTACGERARQCEGTSSTCPPTCVLFESFVKQPCR
jgi:hypothetical protein